VSVCGGVMWRGLVRSRVCAHDEDAVERVDALEEAKDAEGAQQPQQPHRIVDHLERSAHADRDNDDIEDVPRGDPELAEPVGVHVDEQLDQK
jgi:hypothetical protein